jgi:dipeptidyl aminopeptidase/acylaminoacyl peptidase
MEVFHTRSAIAVALLVAAGAANAQIADPAKLFAKDPEFVDATLSPTGEYIAVSTPFQDRYVLSLIRLGDKPERNLFKFDGNVDRWDRVVRKEPAGAYWSDDARLIVFEGYDYGRFGGKFRSGNIFATDADAGKQVQLFGYVNDSSNYRARHKDEGDATLMRLLPDSGGKALFYYQPWVTGNSQSITSVYSVDTHAGSRSQIEQFSDDVGVEADNTGAPRINYRYDLAGRQVVQYRPTATSAWTPMPAALAGTAFNVWSFDTNNDTVYAEISDKGEPPQLYRVNLSTGTRERLTGQPDQEITAIENAGRLGPPVVIKYSAGKPKIDYLDPKSPWAQLHAGLMKAFPGQLISFVDITKDEKKVLFLAYSDRNPGAYYMFDRTTNTPSLLFKTREWIDPAQMSPTMPIEFTNRAGDRLFGFLTIPKGKPGAHPLVVVPHGGPYGISDTWAFDNDTQFLASLGYAVLRVNYRGSGSRGQLFKESGYKQWGTGIQDDIADGVKYVIGQGLADAKKVCIYGASFGGYSAMMNPIRNPGMYKCAIGYAGVYDLKALYEDKDGSKQGRAFFGRTMGDTMLQAAQSPVAQVAKLDVPMLLIHGKSDYTAPFEQFRLAESALAHQGKTYETLVKADEGHGFYKPADQEEAYNRMKAFLQKYNPVN